MSISELPLRTCHLAWFPIGFLADVRDVHAPRDADAVRLSYCYGEEPEYEAGEPDPEHTAGNEEERGRRRDRESWMSGGTRRAGVLDTPIFAKASRLETGGEGTMSGEEVMELGLGEDDLLDREEASSGHATMRTSPRRGDAPLAGASRDQAATPSSVEDLARALLAGSSLTADIRKIARQQAALVVGDLAEVPASRRPAISETEASGLGRRSLLLGHDMVDKFDPADPDSSIERWLQKIDQLGVVHGWTNYERATLAQAKLTGAARRWFFQLEDYDFTWEQWKAKLRAAFPRRREFANMLEELVNRRKQPVESITSYYHDKLALCDRVRITGADAVSCIVSGLPADLRTNAQAARCGTPDELYNSFLAGLESYRGGGSSRTVASRVQVPRREPEAQRRGMVADRVLKRCFNCQKRTDHVSRDCPQPAVDRCRACGEGGHWARECPKRRSCGQGDGQATVATRGGSSTSAQQVRLLLDPSNRSFRHVVFINGERVKAYLDTGSEQNLMAADVARRLGLTVREDGEIQALRGFGGGVVYSLGEVVCDMMLADCRIAIKALITAADLGQIELLLGLPTINGPGVTMVVRGGKTYLTTEPDMEELFRRINLESDGRRPKVVLAEDVTIVPDAITSAKVKVIEGVPGVRYCMSRKEFPCGRAHIVIPAGILSGVDDFVKVMNVGADQIQWKRGRLVSRVQACQGSQETPLTASYQVRLLSSHSSELDISGVIVGDVSERCKESLFELLRRKSCCFSKGDGDLGLTHLGQMQLRRTTEVPVYHRPYRLSFRERELVPTDQAKDSCTPIERQPIPFDTVHVDHLGPFVKSVRGHSYILMVVDGFTKFVLAKPCKTLQSAEAIRRLGEVFGEFGYPRRLISDQGKAFKNKAFMADKGIRHVMNAVATPRANGQVERSNRTIVEALSSTAETEGRWDDVLPDVVWGLNNTINLSTRFAPANLMFSHNRGRVADLADGELASDQIETGNTGNVPWTAAGSPQTTEGGLGYTATVDVPGAVGAGQEAGAIDLGRGAGTADSQSPQASRTEKGGAVDTPTGTNSEQQGDDFAYAPPPAGNPRRKRPRRIPGVTRRSARLLRRQVTTEGCRAEGDVEGGVLSTVLLYGDEQTAAGTSVPGEATHHTALSDGKAQPRDFDSKVLRDRIRSMDRIGRVARKMKSRYDRRRKVAASYKAGELVLWRDAAAQKAGMGISHKLANKFDGPYQVCKVLPNDRYIIGAIKGVRGYKRFTALVAVDSLRRYHSVNEVDYDSNPDSDSGESNPGGQPLAN
ncbi:hypothetical protein NQ315_008952 [Exocentrus adspersus]|uniref:Endonuclease n=1 Tax=Exocentrus adspersus TaxID=1586481 RepID=A0AAV8V969_9CUCU|nr:hypothetical protein NQ315_008952 [Exocentrus adspersus]